MKVFCIAALLSINLLIVGCRPAMPAASDSPAQAAVSPTAPPSIPLQRGESSADLPVRNGLSPAKVVEAYYNWYIDAWHGQSGKASASNGVAASDGYLSEALMQRVDSLKQDLRADPILCAQDVPRSVRVKEVREDGREAQVLLGTSFEGHLIKVHLAKESEGWQIVEVRCGPDARPGAESLAGQGSPAPLVDGRQLYRNDEYGFQLVYPTGWSVEQVVQDPSRPPIGPPSLKLMVLFTPPVPETNPPAPVVPFSLEFTIGDEAAYRAFYGEPTTVVSAEIGGHAAVREEQAINEQAKLVRYVFGHPDYAERRVTFTDPVSGFPERAIGGEAELAQFHQMMESFRFVD